MGKSTTIFAKIRKYFWLAVLIGFVLISLQSGSAKVGGGVLGSTLLVIVCFYFFIKSIMKEFKKMFSSGKADKEEE